jgi:hypothetical protein
MSRREDRERKTAEWLEHLQGWKASGSSLPAYAKSRGLALWTMYRWRSVLRREGLWADGGPRRRALPESAKISRAVPLRFARVSLKPPAPRQSLTLHVELRNGRRAQIELSDRDDLADVLAALEHPA